MTAMKRMLINLLRVDPNVKTISMASNPWFLNTVLATESANEISRFQPISQFWIILLKVI